MNNTKKVDPTHRFKVVCLDNDQIVIWDRQEGRFMVGDPNQFKSFSVPLRKIRKDVEKPAVQTTIDDMGLSNADAFAGS